MEEKINIIVEALKNSFIREQLNVCEFNRDRFHLEIFSEEMGAVDVKNESIADAWILEINRIKKLYSL